ncbi:FAD-dependent oxidoreductase [Paenibacillus sp. UMB7766-LJ446]|uniref:NAD(P)/FAD-dependent oxidoreductase n=1 Tax=Paenibacillus sp. UMB7766-LJ446 TaxID=3046313 RepID=UPI00254B3ED7|nr:FAD-dependent oxidoreductase [Paenibacillus sp. UMB7766-LJ446]MDK8191075.1 FAD-dependent oxidoreductase [Paenibacillus sp. UMB7766-LJ446]
MSKPIDAIVIGAGIAGSTFALQLARQGHRILLLDRQEFPRHKTCGEFMSPETTEMLNYLGIHLGEQELKPSTMDHAKIIMPQGGEIEATLPGLAYGISRYELDRILHEKAAAAGVEIVTRATITNIQRFDDDSYEVEVKQGNDDQIQYRARTVIGAHGSKKPRRMTSPVELRDKTAYVGVKSHFQGITIPSRVELYFCKGGYVGISPIEDGIANVAALLTLDTVRGSGKSVKDILQAASLTNERLAVRLAEGSPVQGTQVSIAPLHLSNVPEPWSQYPHIGDAMLMIPPLCGDGMSIALRSALLCAEWTDKYLQGKISFEQWQHEYSKEANREFTRLLRRARGIQKLAFAKANKFYPGLVRMVPGLATYLVKATRLSEINLIHR